MILEAMREALKELGIKSEIASIGGYTFLILETKGGVRYFEFENESQIIYYCSVDSTPPRIATITCDEAIAMAKAIWILGPVKRNVHGQCSANDPEVTDKLIALL